MSIRTLLLTLGGLGAACLLAATRGNTARGDEQAAAPQELLPVSQRFAPNDVAEEPSSADSVATVGPATARSRDAAAFGSRYSAMTSKRTTNHW